MRGAVRKVIKFSEEDAWRIKDLVMTENISLRYAIKIVTGKISERYFTEFTQQWPEYYKQILQHRETLRLNKNPRHFG